MLIPFLFRRLWQGEGCSFACHLVPGNIYYCKFYGMLMIVPILALTTSAFALIRDATSAWTRTFNF